MQRLVKPRKGLFRVRRTSSWGEEAPPVEGAVLFETRIVDRRSVNDPTKIPANRGTAGDWWDRGENHRVENGNICRDLEWMADWFIKISDVMEFVRQNGTCVVSIDNDGHEAIEIYDDYRE